MLRLLHHLLAAIALGASPLLLALLTLRDEMHLLAECFGDALGHNNLIESSEQLLNRLSVTSFNFHLLRPLRAASGSDLYVLLPYTCPQVSFTPPQKSSFCLTYYLDSIPADRRSRKI